MTRNIHELNHVELDALLALGKRQRGMHRVPPPSRIPERLVTLGYLKTSQQGDLELARRGRWLVRALLG